LDEVLLPLDKVASELLSEQSCKCGVVDSGKKCLYAIVDPEQRFCYGFVTPEKG
jgi:hypothetical protein